MLTKRAIELRRAALKGTVEKRQFTSVPQLIRADGTDARLEGHAAVFNQLSQPLYGWFREKIEPGAFADSIAKDDVHALWNHLSWAVLARKKNGSLTLREDETGLAVVIKPSDTTWGRDALACIARGDVDQMSFGFEVLDERWEYFEGDEYETRTILRARLHEVSPCTKPAYLGTDIGARANEQELEERELLSALRRCLSGNAAPEDRDLVTRTLSRAIPPNAAPTPAPASNPPSTLTLKRRRLELAERE